MVCGKIGWIFDESNKREKGIFYCDCDYSTNVYLRNVPQTSPISSQSSRKVRSDTSRVLTFSINKQTRNPNGKG